MKVFTYNQYIKSIHTLRLNAVFQLAEKSVEYKLNKENNIYSHDKLVKNTLKKVEETTKFINTFLEPREKIKKENLELYTNSYITKKFKTKEADIVYKLKNKEIFFLIEHQSTIDYNMPFRILNYCIDIMQEWGKNKKTNKKTYYPIIVPTVIYTGNQKWIMSKNFREKQIADYVFENYKIDLEYNFIDINKIPNSLLLKQNTMFGYMMFLEKSKNKNEMIENLNTIINLCNKKERLYEIADIVSFLLKNVIENETKEELIKKITSKVGDNNMSTLRERLLDENKKLINKGRREGRIEGRNEGRTEGRNEGRTEGRTEGEIIAKRQIARNMLIKNLEEKIILETTKIDKEELKEIKKELAITK